MNFLNKKLDIDTIDNISITGLTNQLISFCVDKIYKKEDKDIIIITNSLYEANRYYSALSKINNNCYLFPMDDFLTSESIASSPELKSIRISTLNEIVNTNKNIIITNLMGYLRYLPTKELWNKSIIDIKKNEDINKEQLYKKLVSIGYEPDSLVNKTGEVASRGYIIDLYPINTDYPIRIEFWGDTIDSIRYFDIESQKSIKEIDEIKITPYSEFINEKNIDDIEEKQKYLPFVVEKVSSIIDYLNDPIVIYKDFTQLKSSYLNLKNEILEYDKEQKDNIKTDYMNDFYDLERQNNNIYLLTIDNILDIKLNKKYVFSSKVIDKFNSNFKFLNEYLEKCLYSNKKVIIALSDKSKLKNIQKYLTVPNILTNLLNIDQKQVNIIEYDIDEGFEIDDYVVLCENELYKSRNKDINYKNKFKYGTKINDINSLNVGDYVVHSNHGIGMYTGIKTLSKNGNMKDYIEVQYKDNDKLYIPVEKIELLSKYSSNEALVPKINKLGGTEWEKTKLRIKNKVRDIADKLLKIQAERKLQKGFAFKKDDEDEKEFDSEFKYQPTVDQFIAIDKIKKSMESINPMDMLLCGDVGYGKTEVAFRAMFKAVNSGKQVAYLCPTTILSSQQYKSAIERFSNFGVSIALLNRFTTAKEEREIKEKLNAGKIDIIFGTHKLLNNSVKFKDLGLLIVDEEQRFGVTHKEKIKEYKSSIDVLTLSATPIPRTLQMSLVGIRELALIETPPVDRYPVQTYVVEESTQIIREAIYKEMSRKGQVFILFNSVEHIEEKKLEIQRIVPEAKIRIAHGQMNKDEIEDTMMSFINNEFDILLCTTIIETGIDIPNVNTLIIYDADRFGLSQLYQIRGRVGRSNKIAYAYLMYSKNKQLNEAAVKRLNAIKEFTQLGSGFQIAMRDLSIRGAGDILGSEQAGFIDSVGYELYVKILNDEVNRLKGIKVKEEIKEEERPLIEVENHIKDEYVKDESLKIELHQKINGIDSYDKLKEIKEEIEDRFGKIDEELDIYMYSKLFENRARSLDITNIKQTNLYIEIILDEEFIKKLNTDELFMNISLLSTNFKFEYKVDKLHIKLLYHNLDKHFVYYLNKFIDEIEKCIKK
ncbi:MAG: transcription-repair coupling factor [Bacilli bacterium]|nr:transcription-repair coupling factor [Bacilli bacterium]